MINVVALDVSVVDVLDALVLVVVVDGFLRKEKGSLLVFLDVDTGCVAIVLATIVPTPSSRALMTRSLVMDMVGQDCGGALRWRRRGAGARKAGVRIMFEW